MTIRLFGGDYFVGLSVAQGCRATLRGNAFGTFRRPRVPGRTLGQHFRAFPSPGSTAADPFVSRMRLFAHETTLADPPVSRTRLFTHETTSADSPVSRMRRLAHETSLADPSREQNMPSRSRDNLGRPFREQNTPFRSRDNLGRPFREQNTPFRSRDCRERHTRQPRRFFSELRELYGRSTGAPRCRRGSTRASGTRNRT